MAVVQSWDGTARRVHLLPDVTEFHPIDDIYREYRTERRTDETLRQYNPFMAAYGNIPKGGGKATPRYLVLLEGTKIVPYDQPARIVTDGEMISDNPEVDPTVFDLDDLTSSIKILIAPADAEIVYVEIPSPISDNLDYGGTIEYDPTSPYSGLTHPVGTRAQPVNNLADAKNLGELYGISELRVQHGDIVLDRVFSGWKFKADSVERILNFNGYDTTDIYIKGMSVQGNMLGNAFLEQCSILDVTNFHANGIDCALNGTIILEENTISTLGHSMSMIPGLASPVIDMNPGQDSEFSLRGYSGGLTVLNCDTSNCKATVEFIAGKLHSGTGNTDGILSVRGVCSVDGDLTSGTIFDEVFINKEVVAMAVLDEPINDHRDEGTLGSFIRKIFWRSK